MNTTHHLSSVLQLRYALQLQTQCCMLDRFRNNLIWLAIVNHVGRVLSFEIGVEMQKI